MKRPLLTLLLLASLATVARAQIVLTVSARSYADANCTPSRAAIMRREPVPVNRRVRPPLSTWEVATRRQEEQARRERVAEMVERAKAAR